MRAVGHPAAAFADSATYNLIILAMKSYDVAEAVAQLAAHSNPAQVMGTQNGIGVEEIVAGCFGAGRTLAGAVTIPISRQGQNRLLVERAGRGLGIAPVAPGRAVDEWVALFREAAWMPGRGPITGP